MLKKLTKFSYMVRLGSKYIKIFKRTHFHPFISQKAAYTQLSNDRQSYSNKVLKHLNIDVQLIGSVPKENKMLYIINHRSLLDIIVMESLFSRYNKNGTWIAKEELFNAVYGDFFKYSGCISVDVENRRGLLKFFKQIKYVLSKVNDLNVYIFPEGERYKGKGIKKFQNGASKIAVANNLSVVPVFINENLEKVFKNAPYKNLKILRVHVGDIIDAKNLEEEYIKFMNKAKEVQ